eukprot:gene19401-29888_t
MAEKRAANEQAQREEAASKRPKTAEEGLKTLKIHSPSAIESYAEFKRYYEPTNWDTKGVDADGERGRIIDGKKIAEGIRATLKQKIAEKVENPAFEHRKPGLTVILVGENAASKVYIRQKQKACVDVGIDGQLINLPATTSLEALLAKIDELNADDKVDGVLVQLPLPAGELADNVRQVVDRIDPLKDVDGFHPENLGNLVTRAPKMRPCTPWGVMHLIWSTGVNPYGLECLVVGASNHVGRPMVLELLLNGASVQCVHRFSRDLEAHVRRAECVIVAAGKPGLVKGEWIRPGAIVIDIGINRLESGKLV